MKHLFDTYQDSNLILFVGAGISKSLGLPTWEELMRGLATELDFDEEIFLSYGNFRELAEYYKLKTNDKNYNQLKKKLLAAWKPRPDEIENSKIHELIVKGNYKIIYTTNYDDLLERALDIHGFKGKYNLVANVNDLKKKPKDKEIIKFHGDLKRRSKLILGETSYFERLEFENPLDIKFRSDILGKTILFIGYSITDINVRFFLYKLSNTWKYHGYPSKKCISYLFSNTPNSIQKRILEEWNINMISPKKYYDCPSQGLILFLKSLARKSYRPREFSLFTDYK